MTQEESFFFRQETHKLSRNIVGMIIELNVFVGSTRGLAIKSSDLIHA